MFGFRVKTGGNVFRSQVWRTGFFTEIVGSNPALDMNVLSSVGRSFASGRQQVQAVLLNVCLA